MRTAHKSILFFVMACCALTAQTISPGFKFSQSSKPGESLKITGTDLDKVKSVTMKAEGKPELAVDNPVIHATEITFNVPASASGQYTVTLAPGGIAPIPLTVAAAVAAATSSATPPAISAPATTPPLAVEEPIIDSVFPTTTYPVQSHFSFEINGQHFDPDPNNDQIEVEGQGMIQFGSRHVSPSTETAIETANPRECDEEPPARYPCLEVTPDGHRLMVAGYGRRYGYQGTLRVRVWVKNVPSKFSGSFMLSRVDYRIVIGLAFVSFGVLMYIVFRLVTKGIQSYTVAGREYSPMAAFLIDKSTDSFSLSKFQLFALSTVAFFGYVYVFLCRALVQWNFTFPDIPDNYPSLLAISAGTTAAAVGLSSARGNKGSGPVYPSAADFISDGGLVVPERFQFFVWTLIACIGFIALILMQDPAKVSGFPSFPTGLLYVMGVSAGGYLGGKAVRNPGPALKHIRVTVRKDAKGIDTDDLDVILKGENLDKGGRFRIDGAPQLASGAVTGTDQTQGTQDYYAQLEFTLAQAKGFAQGDHTFEIINRDGVGSQHLFTATPMRITAAPPISHGASGTITLTVQNFRPGSSARWLAPGSTSSPTEIAATEVVRTATAAGGDTVTVNVPVGDSTGSGTLTLVSPRGATEATSVMVN